MHKYFGTAKDWGWSWPSDAAESTNTTGPPPPPAPPLDHGMYASAAPWILMGCFVLSLATQRLFGRNIGGVACAWRLSYSPARAAFLIWSVIYLSTFLSALLQLLNELDGVELCTAAPWANTLWAYAWLLCALWPCVFGRRNRAAIVLAACVLVSAAICAVGAVSVDHAWRRKRVACVALVGVPMSLFAGWLCTAAALGVGIAFAANTRAPDACENDLRDYNTRVWADPADARSWESWVPLALAAVLSAGAFLLPDPVLPLPLMWAVFWMRGHLRNWLALEVLAVTVVACCVAIVLDVAV